MAKGYKVDFVTNCISVTKAFAEKAANPASSEFRIIREYKKMGFFIEVQKKKKNPNKSISYTQMLNYLCRKPNSTALVEEFNGVVLEAKSYSNPHMRVQKWFLAKYPEYETGIAAKTEQTNLAPVTDAA